MNISEFNLKTFDSSERAQEMGFQMKPQIICNDGFKMSVQGSSGHYCFPRELDRDYYKMEIGFPSEVEPLIMKWIDGDENSDPTQCVYGYVPCSVIDEVIIKHGGINEELTFKPKL